jgi:hypothetical protein
MIEERLSRLGPWALTALLTACTGAVPDNPSPRQSATPQKLPGSLTVVGQDPLFHRGMNAGLAVWNDFAYVGSRTDGSKVHPHAGVLVVDIHDPGRPKVMGEIGPPDEGNPSETSRVLAILWRQCVLPSRACEGPGSCRALAVRPKTP